MIIKFKNAANMRKSMIEKYIKYLIKMGETCIMFMIKMGETCKKIVETSIKMGETCIKMYKL